MGFIEGGLKWTAKEMHPRRVRFLAEDIVSTGLRKKIRRRIQAEGLFRSWGKKKKQNLERTSSSTPWMTEVPPIQRQFLWWIKKDNHKGFVNAGQKKERSTNVGLVYTSTT